MTRRGFWVRVCAGLLRPASRTLSRHTWRGNEYIPAEGGAILAVNHISHVDPVVVGDFVYTLGRVPRFLTKASVFTVPVVGHAMREAGQIPVHRGTTDAARALDAAVDAVRDGHLVVVYPEGTTTRDPDFWPMHGRTGVARLALATGAPVIPVAQWGAQALYDPNAHRFRPRPRTPVTVVAGPPLDLSKWRALDAPDHDDLAAMSDAIMLHIQGMLAEIRGEQPPTGLYDWPPRG